MDTCSFQLSSLFQCLEIILEETCVIFQWDRVTFRGFELQIPTDCGGCLLNSMIAKGRLKGHRQMVTII